MSAKAADNITKIAQSNFRNMRKKFGIKKEDRRNHMYLIGQTGTGKTTLLETMIREDLEHGEGLAVIDPHGDFIERIAKFFPEHRKDDLIYFNVPDPNCLYGFNPLADIPPEGRALVASGITEACRKIWSTTWGPRLEYHLRNALLTLLEQPRASLADITRLFSNESFRREAISRVTNPMVKRFWLEEYEKHQASYRSEALGPIQNKVGAFLTDPLIYRVMTRSDNNIDIRKIMDEGKVLLVNISKGKLGSDNAALFGALMVSRIELAALSRANIPERQRRDFYLYLDEFQNFTTLSIADMLSELRKYRLNMIMSHQYLAQISEEVRNAILGNVGTIICFRVGPYDAKSLAGIFAPDFDANDLLNVSNFNFYIRLMIEGGKAKSFSAETLPPD